MGLQTVCIKRIDVLSAGMIMGALYVFIGLIVGVFMAIFAILGIAVGGGGGDAALGGVLTGVGSLIIIPLLYGTMGFIVGIIGSALYNLVASFVGGVRMDVEV